MKVKFYISLIFFICFNYTGDSQVVEFSSGIQYSSFYSESFGFTTQGNPYRRGWWSSLLYQKKLKGKLSLQLGLTYQERHPMERFIFIEGFQPAGIGTNVVFRDWPSSPQNEKFESIGLEFERFPNFKYLGTEVIPMYTFGQNLQLSIGVGIFGGVLLNKNEASRHITDFFVSEEEAERYTSKEVTYTLYDFGWTPKVNINYRINEKIGLGLSFKSYQSISRFNDTSIHEFVRSFNQFWRAYHGGISINYTLDSK